MSVAILLALAASAASHVRPALADEREGENKDLEHEVAKSVTAFAICRQITNHNANTVFVPVKTIEEWSSIVNNGAPNIDLASCGTTVTTGCMTSGYDNFSASA